MIDDAIDELTPVVGVRAACAAVGEPRARHYRRHRKSPGPAQARAGGHPPAPGPHRGREEGDPSGARTVPSTPTRPRPRSTPSSSTRGSTWHRSPPCTGSSGNTARWVTARRHATHPARVKPELVATATQRGLQLGHHQAPRPGQVDLLLPVHDHRHLQPLRARVDAGPGRTGQPG